MNERFKQFRAEAQRLACEKHHTGRPLDLGDIEKTPDFRIYMDRVHDSYEFLVELIVKDCAKVLDDKLANPNGASMAWCDGSDLLEHFGVES